MQIGAINSAGAAGQVGNSAQFAAQYQVRVLLMQKDAIEQAGQEALKLIQSAMALAADQGQNLDVRA